MDLNSNIVSQRLNAYFGASPELRQLSDRAAKLMALQKLYEQIAPAAMLPYSRVVKLESQTLTLSANNSAIAAKLRQIAPTLTKMFQNGGCEVTGIQVRVQVTFASPAKSGVRPVLSRVSRNRLDELAKELPDSPLKNALQRLSRKSVKQSSD